MKGEDVRKEIISDFGPLFRLVVNRDKIRSCLQSTITVRVPYYHIICLQRRKILMSEDTDCLFPIYD